MYVHEHLSVMLVLNLKYKIAHGTKSQLGLYVTQGFTRLHKSCLVLLSALCIQSRKQTVDKTFYATSHSGQSGV